VNQLASFFSVRLRVLRCFAFLIAACATICAAEIPKKSFDIPAGPAATTLRTAAQQAGREIMFPAATVAGVRTVAVKGDFTVVEALEQMLTGTQLRLVQDQASGALSIRRDGDSGRSALSRQPASPAAGRGDGTVELDKFEVVEARVSGLVNQGVIPRQENQALYFSVLDRAEIANSGATDINEIFRTLPQVASFEADTQSLTTQRGFATFGAGVTPATKVDLRGFGMAGTTILVNGRRLPVVRETQGGGPDFSRIPISAIERIEVLPGSAGGVYGTNSMGGVINIILKKSYVGRELTLSYGQAAAGGANEVGMTYTEGRALRGGRSNLTWTFDARNRTPMYFEDRPLYRRYLQNNPPPTSGSDIANWVTTAAIVNFIPVPGVVVGRSATNAIEPLNIPGGPGNVAYAQVPANQNGTGLTPASFLPTLGKINYTEPYGRFALFNPSKSISLNLTYDHEVFEERLTWYAELGLGHTEVKFDTPVPPSNVTLQATDIRNPFRTGVVPGYPGQRISFYYHPTDQPGVFQHTKNRTVRLVSGFNGKLSVIGHEWKWALDTSTDYNRRNSFGYTPQQTYARLLSVANTNAAAADFYRIFADHVAYPNSTAYAKLAKSSFRINDDFVWLGAATLRLNGTLLSLPAGPLMLSLASEYNTQSYKNPFENRFDQSLLQTYGIIFADTLPPADWYGKTRQTMNGGAELVIPLLGRKVQFLGIHSLEVVAGYTRTALSDSLPFGASSLGVRFAPIPDVAFRSSFGQGTYPPSDYDARDTVPTDVVGSTTRDPRRGNSVVGNYTSFGGGNPDLLPEETKTWNFGLVLQPRLLKGFSATFDYGFIAKKNGITSMALTTLLANEQYFPNRLARATPTAAETALGWAGQILSADVRTFNTGDIWAQYLDLSVRYTLVTESRGSFSFIWRSTNNREYRTRIQTGAAITDTLDQINAPLKFRGSGSVIWRRGAWTVTPSFSYIESYRDTLNVPVDNSPTVNLQIGYEVPHRQMAETRRGRLLAGTQWILGCNNLADAEPPYVYNGGGSFRSYYSAYDDPRGRYLYFKVKKTL
jgi:iron complex outermembrane receptor protein